MFRYCFLCCIILFCNSCIKRARFDYPVVTFVSATPQVVSSLIPLPGLSASGKTLSLKYHIKNETGGIQKIELTKTLLNQRYLNDAGKAPVININISWPSDVPKRQPIDGTLTFNLSHIEIGQPRIANQDDTVLFTLKATGDNNQTSPEASSPPLIILRAGRLPNS